MRPLIGFSDMTLGGFMADRRTLTLRSARSFASGAVVLVHSAHAG